MNVIITSLSLIADAAEYFDRQTSAAWRIRTALQNAVIWQANGLLYAMQQHDGERLHREQCKLATLRVWARDCIASSFVLDLTTSSIRKTLGLERANVSPHDEAVRVARAKCQSTRSATRFAEYYKAALAQFEERRLQREAAVSDIEDLLQSNGFVLDGYLTDATGVQRCYEEEFVRDEDLYDDELVADQLDRLCETLGNALESMLVECDAQLNAAIITHKIARLRGYKQGIEQMMQLIGVDLTKLAQRQVRLEAAIAEQADAAKRQADTVAADIDAQLAQLQAEVPTPTPAPQRRLRPDPVAQTRIDTETAAAEARAAEDQALAAQATKRSAAAKKAATTRALKKLNDNLLAKGKITAEEHAQTAATL